MLTSPIALIFILVIAGVILWALTQFPEIDATLARLIRVVVIVVCVLYVVYFLFGLFGGLPAINSPRLHRP